MGVHRTVSDEGSGSGPDGPPVTVLPPGQACFPSARCRQVRVPPLGDGGVVASCCAADRESSDFAYLRSQYHDSLVPWDERPDLTTVDGVLAFLQRRALPGAPALQLKRQMIRDLVQRAGEYKFALLDQVLDTGRFWQALERRRQASGKSAAELAILIKPNTMMAWAPYEQDPANVTDPELVLHLIARLHERGYRNIVVAEAQNVYSHWYCCSGTLAPRTAIEVHRWSGIGYPIDAEGYSVDGAGRRDGRFRVVDLTEEAGEDRFDFDQPLCFIPRTSPKRWLAWLGGCRYRRCLGEHPVAPALRDADFRISFATNKTHTSCYNTLTLKNVYGCLPYADKFLEYHCHRDFDWPTTALLREFPFHFGIIDAIFSADGVLGFKADYFPRATRTLIAGEDLVAVDLVGSLKMGLDPLRSRVIWIAAQVFGFPADRTLWLGDDKEPYPDWINIPRRYDWLQYWGEKWYSLSSYLGKATYEMDPHFTPHPGRPRSHAPVGQRFFLRFVRPALNVLEGWGRKRGFRWIWQKLDNPARLRRRYPGLYESAGPTALPAKEIEA